MLRIKQLNVKRGGELSQENYVFRFKDKTIIYSDSNSVGKTTLIRFILFSLGFKIPSTKQINMLSYQTEMCIENSKGSFLLLRNGNNVELVSDSSTLSKYDINSAENRNSLLMFVFDIDNPKLVEQILGCFYIDQDNGWEFSCKGSPIQYNNFDTTEFLSSFFNEDIIDYDNRIKELRQSLSKYKALQNLIGDSNDEIQLSENSIFDASYSELKYEESVLINRRNTLYANIKKAQKILENNSNISDIIESYNLVVKVDGLNPFVLKKDHLYNFDINSNMIEAEMNDLRAELLDVNKRLSAVRVKIKDINPSIDVETISDNAKSYLRTANVDSGTLARIINDCNKEIRKCNTKREELVKKNNRYIVSLQKCITNRINDLGHLNVISGIDFTGIPFKQYFSGTVLHDLCFAYKMGCLDFLFKEFDIRMPLIIDSPGSGERTIDNLDKLVDYLVGAKNDSQLIVSTAMNLNLSIFDWHIKCGGKVFEGNYIEH